jgi:hypothetical protein
MSSNDEPGFVWRPLQDAYNWRWAKVIGVITLSAVIGFIAGRTSFWTSQFAGPASPAATGEAKAPLNTPGSTKSDVAQTASVSATRQEPPAYVVINPGTATAGSEKQPHDTASDANEMSDVEELANEPASHASSDRKRLEPSSSARLERRLKRDQPASDYQALREYVLRP